MSWYDYLDANYFLEINSGRVNILKTLSRIYVFKGTV